MGMTILSTKDNMAKIIKPTLEDAFSLGRAEGLKEAFREIKKLLHLSQDSMVKTYIEARLRSIEDFENKNPFKK